MEILKSKRILYLAPALGLTINQSGGAGTHMRGVVRGFRENGFEVLPIIGGDVLNPEFFPEKQQNLDETKPRKNNVREIAKKLMPNKIRLFFRDVRTVLQDYKLEKSVSAKIREFGPDVIYERAAYLSTYGSRLARKLNIPHFLETDGCMVEIISQDYGVFSEAIGNAFERHKLAKADYAVVMNKLAVGIVATKFNLPENKFVVKTLGVEPADFRFDVDAVQALKSKYQLGDKFVVGFVGAISTYHGVNYLIDAAEALQSRRIEDVIILIVGWSREGEALKQKAIEKGLKNVIFTGTVDKSQVANYYKLMHVGVIPDCEQGIYPIKVLEYGLMGLCPLVPEYQVFKEIIFSEKNGFYFSPKNAESLAQMISQTNEKRWEVEACAHDWNKFVISNFEWKNSVHEIVAIIRQPPKVTLVNS